MKKSFLIILSLFLAQMMNGQTEIPKNNAADPFCRMIKTIYSCDALGFNSQFKEKQVFEIDTVTLYGKVIVKKQGTKISFLRIIPDEEDKELIFCNDSAWLVDHINKKIECMGTDLESLAHNYYSNFFPFSLYNLDTTVSRVDPFWKIIDINKDFTVISLDITNTSPDLSDTRVEFTVGNSDFLPYRSLQESVYMKADKFMQEQVFSHYSTPGADELKVPEYITRYKKDFSLVLNIESNKETSPKNSNGEIYLHDITLFDLAKKPIHLPEDGIIFFDLWYVGCPPCMKSAPVVEKLYNEYRDKVYFFSINETDQDTVKIARFRDKMGITFPVLLGSKEKLSEKINGRGSYPVFILMDAESGKVLWKMEGYSEDLEIRISEAINQNL